MKPATKIEIAQAGAYLGHWQGPWMLAVADLEAMVRNVRGDVVIDYEHATQWADAGEPVPAAGWITRLWAEPEADGRPASLWGEVRWTDRAAEMIASEEYRFLSPVIDLWAVDPNTGNPCGPKLLSVALTNTPFMEGMTPVASSTRPPGALQCLTPASATLVLNHKRPKEGAPSSTQTPTPAMSQTETGLRAYLNRAAKKLRMNTAEPDEVDVLVAAQEAAEKAAALDAAHARVAELEAEVQTLKDAAHARAEADAQARADVDQALLDAAVADYKIPEADRAAWGERLNANREATTALINSIPAGTVRPSGAARVQPPAKGMVNSTARTTDRSERRANARAAFSKTTK